MHEDISACFIFFFFLELLAFLLWFKSYHVCWWEVGGVLLVIPPLDFC